MSADEYRFAQVLRTPAIAAHQSFVVQEGQMRTSGSTSGIAAFFCITHTPALLKELRMASTVTSLYVDNLVDRDIMVLRIERDTLMPAGSSAGLLQQHPAAT